MDAVDIEVGEERGVGFVQVEVNLKQRTGGRCDYGLEEGGATVLGAGDFLPSAHDEVVYEKEEESALPG